MVQSDLTLMFVNDTGLEADDVYVSFQNPNLGTNEFDVRFSDGGPIRFESETDLMSVPVSLAQIGKAGLIVSKLAGAVIFVSYGAPLNSRKSAPSYIGKGAEDYHTPFQPFELTRTGSPTDQGDLTAINYFTAPMAIQSYCGGPQGDPLQAVEYTKDVQTLATALQALTHSSPDAVIKHEGRMIRIIGPSSYGPGQHNPYPTLKDYVISVHHAGQVTQIVNHNAFNIKDPRTQILTNYDFGLDLKATAKADGSIEITGEIHTTLIPEGQPAQAGPSFTHCTLILRADPEDLYDYAIYGQVISEAMSFSGGWLNLKDYIHTVGLDAQSAYEITQNLAVGEITSGLLMGFVNSDVTPAGATQPLKDMPSAQWWSLKPVQAFSSLQPAQPRYNVYANTLYWGSENSVYSIPYSDRLGDGPLVNTVQYEGRDVDTWVVTLGPPVSTLKL